MQHDHNDNRHNYKDKFILKYMRSRNRMLLFNRISNTTGQNRYTNLHDFNYTISIHYFLLRQ